MKKKAENSTVNYDPEMVIEGVEITFTKVTSSGNTTINGAIRKDGAEVGSVSYDERGGFLITSLKPYVSLTQKEVSAVYSAIPGYILEMIDE